MWSPSAWWLVVAACVAAIPLGALVYADGVRRGSFGLRITGATVMLCGPVALAFAVAVEPGSH
jgi:hypothetical protein